MKRCKYCDEPYDEAISDAKEPMNYCSHLCEIIEIIEPELND